jgi:hypothetical protein
MGESLSEKIQRLEKLTPKEKEALDALMAYPNEKEVSIAGKAGMGESTWRNFMTDVYEKLGIPRNEKGKSGIVVREYSEAYRERYLKVGEIPQRPPKPPDSEPTPSQPINKPRTEQPRINLAPLGRRVNRNVVIGGMLGGFCLISVCAIGFLVMLLVILNLPSLGASPYVPPVAFSATDTAAPLIQSTYIPTQVISTSVPIVEPTIGTTTVATPIPTTPANLTSPTPKAFYNQGESVTIRDGVSVFLNPNFLTASWNGCVNNPGFVAILEFENKGSNDFLARYELYGVSAKDDTGKTYEIRGSGSGKCTSSSAVSTTISGGRVAQIVFSFYGEIPTQARYIDITVDDISGSGKIIFRKDL